MILIKKINIIKKNETFSNIINNKKNYKNIYFTIYIKKNNLELDRFGISIPKKTGNAVIRNKIKRQIKDIIDKSNITPDNGLDFVLIVRKDILKITYSEMQKSLIDLINYILIKEEREI